MEPAQLLLPGADLAGAIAAAAPGAALMLAPGEFRFDGLLTTRDDLTIAGAGPQATTLVGETEGAVLWHHAGPGVLRLRGLALRQHVGVRSRLGQDGRADLLVATGGALEVRGCAFPALEGGVEPLDEFQDPLTGWFFKRGGTAIVLRDAVRAALTGCAFARDPAVPPQDTVGVEVQQRAHVTIAGCTFTDLDKGVDVALGATLDLAGSAFTGCATGVDCSYWDKSYEDERPQAPRAIAGCSFTRCDLALIIGGPQRSTVRGCGFVDNRQALLIREEGADMVGCTFRGSQDPVADPFGVGRYQD